MHLGLAGKAGQRRLVFLWRLGSAIGGGTEALVLDDFSCKEFIVIQVTGTLCRCLFNIVGLLSFTSQLELGANVDPCEPY